jgi:lactoylglutathione lyase
MSSWPGGIGAITLFVDELSVAKEFYLKVFGLPVTYEDDDSAVFTFQNTLVNLLSSKACNGRAARGRIPRSVHHRGG